MCRKIPIQPKINTNVTVDMWTLTTNDGFNLCMCHIVVFKRIFIDKNYILPIKTQYAIHCRKQSESKKKKQLNKVIKSGKKIFVNVRKIYKNETIRSNKEKLKWIRDHYLLKNKSFTNINVAPLSIL